ncbi:large subunit ribosomal protein L3 [Methanohalophilus levihalophilus]|uniref:50S ribosomal protein L3 n=1 Tax=Methanohalophilus levihalophilus TaxID=1431282 RepID=UPI001AE986B1|nr:50S ribosomal protein L3 [Methanohalophilus levihalophilus]MBP2029217.1 large subunit ribosomal protein L3 [Methanohalophilus levihalophilus]
MSDTHRPRRGSLAFSPRKKAKSHIPRFRSWPESNAEPKLQGFAGYKVGMTHVVMVDDTKNSLTEGAEISVPVTILETPAIGVAAIRAYKDSSYGEKSVGEAWATDLDADIQKTIKTPVNYDSEKAIEKLASLVESGDVSDVRVITYTLPSSLTGVPKKNADIMETGISGKDVAAKFEYAKSILGSKVNINDVFNGGHMVDVAAITIGHGTQGPVKRWGIQLQKHKHSRQGSLRQVGTLGPWHPAHVSWRVPLMGQMGYHQRTEYNKRILKISSDADEINPDGGFVNYGLVRGDYVLIKGSVPGPSKRLVRLREPTRSKVSGIGEPQVLHISTQSRQG